MSSNWGNAQQNSEVYIQDREQTKDKHMETGGMITKKSAECVRNRSLVLQSPCRGNEIGVIIPKNNGRGYR